MESEKWEVLIFLLTGIQTELQLMNLALKMKPGNSQEHNYLFVPFKGSEIYLFFIVRAKQRTTNAQPLQIW
jgi:hypothetical protein